MLNGKHGIHINRRYWGQEAQLILSFGVRNDEIENLANECRSDLSDKDKKETWTVGCEYGNWIGVGYTRWDIFPETKEENLDQEIYSAIKYPAIDFFSRYGDAEGILIGLTQEESIAQRICPFPSTRAVRRVAAAVVAGMDPIAIRTLIEEQKYYLRDILKSSPSICQFEAFLESNNLE